jgi:hypothetical protein
MNIIFRKDSSSLNLRSLSLSLLFISPLQICQETVQGKIKPDVTVKASNFATNGNFGPFLARSVAS